MKYIKSLMLFCIGAMFIALNAVGQTNPNVAVLPSNNGIVAVGSTIDVLVQIGNTGTTAIATAKLRPIITLPASVTFAPNGDQTGLPTGWTILTNTGSQIRLCNSTTTVGASSTTDITLKVVGVTVTGPQTFSGQINFGNGTTCASGTSTPGNNTADDNATSTIEVIAAAACNLSVSTAAGSIVCNGGTTTLTATPSGAVGAVEYSITGGAPFQASNSFTVPAGTYTVTARQVASPTCIATSSAITVSQPTPVVASGSVTTAIASAGGSGVITISATGGTAPYTGIGTFNRTAGTYNFTVTDVNGCTGSTSVTINDPAPCVITGVTATAGAILCNGGTTTVTAVAAPTGPAYQYSLNGGAFQASGTFANVSAGAYTIVAREAGNQVCTATASGTIAQPTAVTVTGSVTTPIAVPGGTGTITFVAAGGTAPYEYNITGPAGYSADNSNGIFETLSAGAYIVIASDQNGCNSAPLTVTLANPGIATANPAVGQMFFTSTTGVVQNANTLLLAPNTDLYDINVPFFNLNQANPVPNGTINFRINLGRKLVLSNPLTLASAPLNAYFSWSQSSVNGDIIITGTQIANIPADFDAVATFRVKGDSACRSNVVSNIDITNILQTLNDDDLNNNSSSLQYNFPITLAKSQVNVTCNGAGNGIINIVASSGTVVVTTGPGGYTNTTGLPSGVNNFSLVGLAPGVYSITATASSVAPLANCSATTTVTILQPTVLTLPTANVTSTNIICFGANDGTISVVGSGGTAPYTYTIAGPTVNTTGVLSGVFTGLSAGSYTVTVTDNNGCTAVTAAIIITQPVGGIPDISLGSDISGTLFLTPGVTQTIVYNIAEIGGNSAVGDTLRITRVNGFTINFNPTLFSATVGGTPYTLDNTRWKIDNSNPAFVSIILTDPSNTSGPGTLLCNQRVNVAVTITRNTPNISLFALSAQLRRTTGEIVLNNNNNVIRLTAE